MFRNIIKQISCSKGFARKVAFGICALVICGAMLATTPVSHLQGTVSGGALNGRALKKPAPSYPPAAKMAKVAGTVNVEVLVDESGKVESAKAVNGHKLLQNAAVQAAYQARFSPTVQAGKAVKVSGTISYEFVL